MTNKITTLSRPVPRFTPRPSLIDRLQAGLTELSSGPILILALIGIGLITHGLHMFHYPAFTLLDDEGIYTSQAWAIIREHTLTPYTYFYDHAPLGWILLAGWMWLTGGVRTF